MKRMPGSRFGLQLVWVATSVVTLTAMLANTPAQAAPSARARAGSGGVTVSRWQGGAGMQAVTPGPHYRPPASSTRTVPAATAASAWAIQPTPKVRVANGTFAGESCPSARRCQAVGSYTNLAGLAVTLAERWDGNGWTIEATPTKKGAMASAIAGVSCAADNACIAVGGYIDSSFSQLPLAEVWDGAAWNMQPIPNPVGSESTFLTGVSCPGPLLCFAVGSQFGPNGPGPVAEEWNGARWRLLPTPDPNNGFGALSAVSCARPNSCIAVGSSSYGTLVESWNGTAWRLQVTPNPTGSFLAGVSCPAGDSCEAVGGYLNSLGAGVTLAEAWNGRAWTQQPTPNPRGAAQSALLAVSCPKPGVCTAVGASDGAPLAEAIRTTTWKLQPIAGPAGGSNAGLNGVSCVRFSDCSAVGSYTDAALIGVTLAEGWNGAAWTVQATRNLQGSAASALQADSCPGASSCEAVGFYASGVAGGALAEVRSGSSWTVQPTTNPAGATQTQLYGIDCPAANACVAVGQSAGPAGLVTLAETWNGNTWKIVPTPALADSFASALEAVSCSAANACTAVGFNATNTAGQVTLAEQWNGHTWSVQPTPNPSGSFVDILDAVSCSVATACTAVGNDVNASGTQVPLAESWDGTSWKIHHTPVPSGALAAALLGVSCTGAAACTAVGGHVNQSQIGVTLVEIWDGTAWKIQHSPNPAGAPFATLAAVTCAPGACTAVGYTGIATLAEVWNGTAWTVQPTPNPAEAVNSALLGVACTAAPTCTAVGASINAVGFESTLAEARG